MCLFVILCCFMSACVFFFFKQKTAYEMRISDWSSDVCSSDLQSCREPHQGWIFSIQLKKVFSHVLGTMLMRPSRTAAIGGCARVSASTYPLSVSQGSITPPPLSPKGVCTVRGSASCPPLSLSLCGIRQFASFIRLHQRS